MENHVWIDGPDGPGYHCPVCGVSRCEDVGDSTCFDILRERGAMKTYLLEALVDGERGNWIRWQREQTKTEVPMTRGEWYAKRLREWLKGVWIWKNIP